MVCEYSCEIMMVDNSSQDATVEIVKSLPKIKLIESKKKVGFSAASNQAVKRAKGEILFFKPGYAHSSTRSI